jgi:hypothetical protein
MTSPTEIYLAALSTPDEEHLAALAPLLADDVRAAGLFSNGQGPDEVLASTGAPPFPVLAAARWQEPAVVGDTVTIRGTLPPGLPVAAAVVTVRIRDGKLAELVQELEPSPPPPPTPVDIDGRIAEAINGAFANKTPITIAYVDAEGRPHLSPRGTTQAWSTDRVALWARDPNGGLLRAIKTNPHVALFYRDPATRETYELAGRARVVTDSADRAAIFDRSPATERNFDPLRRGEAVIIDLDSVTGAGPGGRVHMQRGSPDSAT